MPVKEDFSEYICSGCPECFVISYFEPMYFQMIFISSCERLSVTHSEAEVVLVFVVNSVGKVLVAGLR